MKGKQKAPHGEARGFSCGAGFTADRLLFPARSLLA